MSSPHMYLYSLTTKNLAHCHTGHKAANSQATSALGKAAVCFKNKEARNKAVMRNLWSQLYCWKRADRRSCMFEHWSQRMALLPKTASFKPCYLLHGCWVKAMLSSISLPVLKIKLGPQQWISAHCAWVLTYWEQ